MRSWLHVLLDYHVVNRTEAVHQNMSNACLFVAHCIRTQKGERMCW